MQKKRKVFLFATAGAAMLAAILCAGITIFGPEGSSVVTPAPASTPGATEREGSVAKPAPAEMPKAEERGPISAFAPPSTGEARVRAVTVQESETEYLHAKSDDEREIAARQLASLDTVESVQILGRLFGNARAYPEKVALVGALTDAQGEETLEGKLAILRMAVAAGQPKPVRSAALDVMAQLDDPRAVEMLRQTAKHDPDKELREVAKGVLPPE